MTQQALLAWGIPLCNVLLRRLTTNLRYVVHSVCCFKRCVAMVCVYSSCLTTGNVKYSSSDSPHYHCNYNTYKHDLITLTLAQTSDRIASMYATFTMIIYSIDSLAINITMHTSVDIQLYIMLLRYLHFNNNVQTVCMCQLC